MCLPVKIALVMTAAYLVAMIFIAFGDERPARLFHRWRIVEVRKLNGDTEYTVERNDVVKRFGEKEFEGKYNEFIDGTLDNPWFRILISDINDITDDDYEPFKERMDKTPDSDDIIKMIKGVDKDTLVKIEQYIKKLKK